MDAGRLLRTARQRSGLTQRALAKKARVPQPMISVIERGLQDPRHATLERLLKATHHELDLVANAGVGVDRTQFVESLRLSPEERVERNRAAADFVGRVRKARRLA